MDRQITTLIEKLQQEKLQQSDSPYGLFSTDHDSDLDALVEFFLRSRPVGRSPKGQALEGIYLEIYELARAELKDVILKNLRFYKPHQVTIQEWRQILLKQTFSHILTDEQLKRLALEAQRHPPKSVNRQHALSQLVVAIRLSGRLSRPHRGKFSPQFFELLYEEAVNRTLTYICRRIDNYDPLRGEKQKFMNWVNFRLDRMIIDCRTEFSDRQTQELPDLEQLDQLFKPEIGPTPSDLVRECLELDTEDRFNQAHIRGQPNANFRAIALARLSGKSWEEISVELNVKVPTISSFYQRCCQKFAPQFQEYLEQ